MKAQESNFPIEKWDNLGLLQDIPDDRKQNTCDAYNIILNYLIQNEDKFKSLETIPFSIIYKITKHYNLTEEDVLEIINESIHQCEQFIKNAKFEDLDFYSSLYLEADFISYYSEKKIEELNRLNSNRNIAELRVIKEETVNRWEKLGLLDGLDENTTKLFESRYTINKNKE